MSVIENLAVSLQEAVKEMREDKEISYRDKILLCDVASRTASQIMNMQARDVRDSPVLGSDMNVRSGRLPMKKDADRPKLDLDWL